MKLNFDQIITKFNQLDRKVRIGVFLAILVLIFLLDFFTLMALQRALLRKTSADTENLKNNIERLQSDVQRIQQIKVGVDQARSRSQSLERKVRSSSDVSSLLEDISRIANEKGVKIEQLTPRTEPPKEPSKPAAAGAKPVSKYSGLPIVIQATCGYHVFGQFINQLESANLFFALTDFTIEDKTGDVNRLGITATINVALTNTTGGGQQP